MAGLREDLIPVIAEGFDIENELIDGNSHLLIVLRYDGRDDIFQELFRYYKGHKKTFDKYRQKAVFEIATLDNLFGITKRASHLSYDGLVYSVNTGDIAPPDNDRWTWLFYATISDNTYIPLDEPVYTTPEGVIISVVKETQEILIGTDTSSLTLAYVPIGGNVEVYYNGLRQNLTDYVILNGILTASFIFKAGSKVILEYIRGA